MLLGSVFYGSINAVTVKNTSIQVSGLNGNDAIVTNGQGQQVDPSQIQSNDWTGYNVSYNWSIPDNVNISNGDTATVTLPSGMMVNEDTTGELIDSNNQVVGTVTFKKGSSIGTIVFNDALHNKYGKQGTLSVTAVKSNDSDSSASSGDTGSNEPTWGINKVGWIDQSAENNGIPTKLYWDIVINPQGNSLKNVKVTDTIGENQTYDEGSAKVYTIDYSDNSDSKRTGTINANVSTSGNQLVFDIGDIDTAVEIEYETNITNIDVNSGNLWNNQAEVTATNMNNANWTKTKDTATVNWGTGGTVESYAGKIKITKVDSTNESVVLPGAEFELKDKNDSVIRENLVTDSDGKVEIDNLPDGEYKLIETKAPNGYQLNSTPIEITVSDDNNHVVSAIVKDLPISSSSSEVSSSSSSKKSSSSSEVSSSSSNKKSSSSSEILSSSSSEKSSSLNCKPVASINTSSLPKISEENTKSITSENSSNKMNLKSGSNVKENSNTGTTINSSSNEVDIIGVTNDSSSNQGQSKNVQNKSKDQELPQTGEMDTSLITIIGMILLAITGSVIIFKRH